VDPQQREGVGLPISSGIVLVSVHHEVLFLSAQPFEFSHPEYLITLQGLKQRKMAKHDGGKIYVPK